VAAAEGERAAYRAHGSAALRHYREGVAPVASLEAALASPAMGEARLAWSAERIEAARAGDLGYAMGRYADARDPTATLGYFLRVWRREAGAWKVALDVANAAKR
jgi:hypothetical protein